MIWGSSPGRSWEFFSSSSLPDRLWGPASLLFIAYQGLFPLGVKRPGREACFPSLKERSRPVRSLIFKSLNSSVSIALGYGLDDRGSRVRLLAGAGNFSLHHHVQNGSGAHPASYTMGTRGSFHGGKAVGA
jgi:hypothetical protein